MEKQLLDKIILSSAILLIITDMPRTFVDFW